MLDILTLPVGSMQANCYVVHDSVSHTGIVIDPGDDADYISGSLLKSHINPVSVVATHGHFDHIMAASTLQLNFSIPFYIHPDDLFLLGRMQDSARHYLRIPIVEPEPFDIRPLQDGDMVAVGTESLTVLHTPGHTPGSICIYYERKKVLFTGDTIFSGGAVGRTDWSYGNAELLRDSIQRICALPVETVILPGHGQATSVGVEIRRHVIQ